MVSTKSLIYERKGEKDGFAQRFGKEIPDGTLIFMEGKEGTGKSVFAQRFCASMGCVFNSQVFKTSFNRTQKVLSRSTISFHCHKG